MPTLTHDQLSALAKTGALNREIEAALGRAMTPDERTIVDRARVLWRLSREAKRHKAKLGSSDRHTAITSERSKVDRVPCAGRERRERLEADDEAWLKWYCADTYYLPFEKPHTSIIEKAREAILTGADATIAAERGVGKSFLLFGMTFKYAVTGEQRFPVYIPWSEKEKEQGFNFWLDCLCNNERIAADYPEICAPFVHAQGVSQRIMTTTWRDTGQRTGARSLISKGLIIFPDGRGVIGSSSMGGNPRGMHYKAANERPIRPTMALIDDIQDDKIARSPDGVKKTIQKVNGAIRGLKRAGSDFAILMSGNCICSGDVMDHFLNQAGWNCVRVACVERWPVEWDEPKSDTRRLWDEWGDLFHAGKGEVAFYRKHREVMTRGMVMSSPRWYAESQTTLAKDKRNKISPPVDCFHGVLRDYYRMGHEAFMAERQQTPIDPIEEAGPYTITPTVILARTTKRKQYEIPAWATRIFASSDINPSYALSTVVIGYGEDQTAAILWYGVHKLSIPVRDMPAAQYARALYPELVAHGQALAGMPCKPEAWAMDAGGAQFDAIAPYATQISDAIGFPAMAFTGRSWKAYRDTAATVIKSLIRENVHAAMAHKAGMRLRWHPWNTDYWGEKAQRAWLGPPGAPGSISLPAGTHAEIARQICNQRLLGAGEIGGRMTWNFHKLPGKNDFHDAIAQCYALAAYSGIGTGGQSKPKRRAYTTADFRR